MVWEEGVQNGEGLEETITMEEDQHVLKRPAETYYGSVSQGTNQPNFTPIKISTKQLSVEPGFERILKIAARHQGNNFEEHPDSQPNIINVLRSIEGNLHGVRYQLRILPKPGSTCEVEVARAEMPNTTT